MSRPSASLPGPRQRQTQVVDRGDVDRLRVGGSAQQRNGLLVAALFEEHLPQVDVGAHVAGIDLPDTLELAPRIGRPVFGTSDQAADVRRLRRLRKETRGFARVALGAAQVQRIQQRDAQVQPCDGEPAVDLPARRGTRRPLPDIRNARGARCRGCSRGRRAHAGRLAAARSGRPATRRRRTRTDSAARKDRARPVRCGIGDGSALDGDRRRADDALSFFNRKHLVGLLTADGVDPAGRPRHADARRRSTPCRART